MASDGKIRKETGSGAPDAGEKDRRLVKGGVGCFPGCIVDVSPDNRGGD